MTGVRVVAARAKPDTDSAAPQIPLQRAENPDDANAGAASDPRREAGSLYSVIAPVPKIGEFNHSRIVVRGKHVAHWLNGGKVVGFDMRDAAGVGDQPAGSLVGGVVSDIRVRRLE